MKAPTIVIIHIKNEEYMLKWWLQHHVNKFDGGVVIDYNSTDGSLDLVKKLAPNWTIVKSVNKDFSALNCDIEVFNIEKQIQQQYRGAYVIVLNVTEYLIGDTTKLAHVPFRVQKLVPCDIICDMPNEMYKEPDENVSLIKQRFHGVQLPYDDKCRFDPYQSYIDQEAYRRAFDDPSFHQKVHFCNRVMRSLHNFNLNYMETSMYGTGRHYWGTPCEDFRILWYGFSPFTRKMLDRKIAIQHEVPAEDKAKGIGPAHNIDDDKALARLNYHQEFAKPLDRLISKYEPDMWR